MKVALITGISGQDGIYLTEFLLNKGYRVIGTVRNRQSALIKLPDSLLKRTELVEWDLLNQDKIIEILSSYKPVEIYNLAAFSSGAGMYEDPLAIAEINGLAVTRILEAIREVDKNIRFCQASSREIFGAALESPQNENTLVNPRSPYGAAKLYADAMIRIYRRHYAIFACSAILFNHESPQRGLDFVTRKITHHAVKIKLGQAKELHLGSLDALRDWGFAGDTVYAMWLMLQYQTADDYIVATGKVHSVREFCEYAFRYLGLNYLDFVQEDVSSLRLSEPVVLVGDSNKIHALLGWSPQVDFKELVEMMVESDMKKLTINLKH